MGVHVGNHQICSFLQADNYSIMSHSKMHLEQTTQELIEEAERWDLVPKPASPVLVEHLRERGQGRHDTDLPEQRRAVENKMQKDGGTSLQRFLSLIRPV